jgi:raffinose/stachyose/melibiose transport system substrate-binding protein
MLRRVMVVLILLAALVPASYAATAKGGFEYWSYWDEGHPNDQLMRTIATDFEQETGIKVNFLVVGRDILNKVRPALVQGNPPDLIDGHGIEMWPALIKDGVMLSVEDLFNGPGYGQDKNVKFSSIFVKGADTQWANKGIRYFVPYTNMTSVIWYNKKIFAKLGLTIPKTLTELANVCKKIQAAGLAPFCQDGGVFYDAYFFYWASLRINGPNVALEAALDPTAKKWDNPGLLKAAQVVARFASDKWIIANAESNTWPAGQVDFVQGKGAMLLCGSWVVNETFDKTAADFEYGAFPFPAIEGGKGNPGSAEMELLGWAIPKAAKNPKEAKEFIRFAMQEKYQVKFFDVYYNPARKGLGKSAPVEIKDVVDIIEKAAISHTMFDGLQAQAEWWTKVLLPLNQELLYGRITAAEFISKIKQKQVEFYKAKT